MKIVAVTRLKARPGKGVGLLVALSGPLEETRSNQDCSSAGLFISADNPQDVVLLEEWSSREAQTKHASALQEDGSLRDVTELLDAPPDTRYYRALEHE